MSNNTETLYKKFQRSAYFPELKQTGILAGSLCFSLLLYGYGNQALAFIFSATGLMCSTFFFAGIAIAYCIKIYYRMMVIKYYEKDTRIRLLENF